MASDHLNEKELASYLAHTTRGTARAAAEEHLSSCPDCLAAAVAAHEAVELSKNDKSHPFKGWLAVIRKISPYLILAGLSFTLSFFTPRYFIQLLVATLLLGAKWVTDSKTTKMLIMIHEAWKRGGEGETSKVLERMEAGRSFGERSFREKPLVR